MLQKVKDYLKITWDDENTHIQGIVDRGKAYLNELVGVELDYTTAGEAHEAYGLSLAEILAAVKRENDPITTEEAIILILAAEAERDESVVQSSRQVALLLDYCRYAYNNASEYFEENFQHEILRLQLMTGVSLLPVDGEEDET